MNNKGALFSGALVLVAMTHPAIAAERLGRLTVNLKIDAQEQWSDQRGNDKATVRTAQTVSFTTVMKTDGDIVDFNQKDPGYYQQQMAKAAQNAQAVTSARGEKPMTEAEFKARVQKEQAACKGDTSCLMALSQKVSVWSQQLMAGQSAQPPAQQGSGSYMDYLGFPDCGAKVHITVNDVVAGSYADVQGAVPITIKHTADYNANKNELLILCSQTNLVIDTKQKMFYGDGWLIQQPQGTSTITDRGKTTTSQTSLPMKSEAIQWASEQLRRAPLSGSRKTVVKITNSNGSGIPFVVTRGGGTANVELTWRFEEL